MSKVDQIRALRERTEARAKVRQKTTQARPWSSVPAGMRSGRAAPEGVPKPSDNGTPSPTVSKVGRPRIENREKTLKALEPWKAANMSRASWYRRKATK